MQIYGFEWLDGRLFKIGGFWMLDAGYRMLDVGCCGWLLVASI
jgi:hypothetical protein